MRPPSATRLYVRRFLRARTPKVLILLFIILNVLDVFRIHRDIAEGEKARYQLQPRPAQRLYIASMHFNNGKILRSHWIKELIRLTDTFGAQNMFVSVHESGSWDDSKSLLRGLDRELERRAVPRRIVISDVTHKDEMLNEKKGDGWIDTSRGQRELRRIPYLAKLRNEVMQDLYDMHKKGIRFDKVIFLNDVVFKVRFKFPRPSHNSARATTDTLARLGGGCNAFDGHQRRQVRGCLLSRLCEATELL